MANDFYDVEISKVTGYAEKKVDRILRPLVEALFADQPDEPVQYMIDWLLAYQNKPHEDQKEDMQPFRNTRRGRRQAISAEPVAYLDQQNVPTKVIPKSEYQKGRIKTSIKDNLLFSSLDAETLSMVIDGMFEMTFKDGDKIIEQGGTGDNFYVLETGTCDCFVASGEGVAKLVKQYEPGESFGELALMYNSSRAASIITTSDVVVWAMDRLTFRKGVMDTTSAKRKRYEELLKHVPVLQVLDKYERAKVADALQEQSFEDGDYIITQGEEGHEFYIISEGMAKVTKRLGSMSEEEDIVLEIKKGDYFGELALLNDSPRAANVIAVGDCKCIQLDRDSFERLLGPCKDIIKRSKKTYEEIEKRINQQKIQALSGGKVQKKAKKYNRKRRAGVSAEPFSVSMAAPDGWNPPVYDKTEEQRQRIMKAVSNNILYQNLPPEMMNTVVEAMFERKYHAGDYLITQGGDGDYFFVLDEGICDCYLNQPAGKDPLLVKTYEHGESFGELALMYNAKRAASVKARNEVTVYAMDRMTFRHILMDRTSKKRKLYESFLESVPLLANLDKYERAKIADALEEVEFQNGEKAIVMGQPGESFYLVVEGKAVVTKPVVENGPTVQVMEYTRGSYFGELALLNGAPRAANVVAIGHLKCVYIDRNSFVRLLGPCDEIMKRAQDLYREREQQIVEGS